MERLISVVLGYVVVAVFDLKLETNLLPSCQSVSATSK